MHFFTPMQISDKPQQTSWCKFQTTSTNILVQISDDLHKHLGANFRQSSINILVQKPPQTSWCKFQTNLHKHLCANFRQTSTNMVQISDKPPQTSCCKFHTNLHKHLGALDVSQQRDAVVNSHAPRLVTLSDE